MSQIAQQLLSAEEFWSLPDDNMQRALVRGEIIETMPPGGRHGAIAVEISSRLRMWVKDGNGGYVGVEAGFALERSPDTVREPDVSYVYAARIPASGVPEAFWELAPDLAVEVVSPTETADEVHEKVRDFLHAGTPLVWVVYPRAQAVVAHTPDGTARTYGSTDTISFPDVLPGFTCIVAELFAL